MLASDWPGLASARAARDNSRGSDPGAYQGRAWDPGCHEPRLNLYRILSNLWSNEGKLFVSTVITVSALCQALD